MIQANGALFQGCYEIEVDTVGHLLIFVHTWYSDILHPSVTLVTMRT